LLEYYLLYFNRTKRGRAPGPKRRVGRMREKKPAGLTDRLNTREFPSER
jgi:hypothetical protein